MSLILVADKEENRRKTLIEIIESIGNREDGEGAAADAEEDFAQEDNTRFCYQCILYGDGNEAEDGVSDPMAMFSLAILSTDLEPNGIELLRRMRQEGDDGLKSLPVIIVSTEKTYKGKPIEEVVREFNAHVWNYKDINQLRQMVKDNSYEAVR